MKKLLLTIALFCGMLASMEASPSRAVETTLPKIDHKLPKEDRTPPQIIWNSDTQFFLDGKRIPTLPERSSNIEIIRIVLNFHTGVALEIHFRTVVKADA